MALIICLLFWMHAGFFKTSDLRTWCFLLTYWALSYKMCYFNVTLYTNEFELVPLPPIWFIETPQLSLVVCVTELSVPAAGLVHFGLDQNVSIAPNSHVGQCADDDHCDEQDGQTRTHKPRSSHLCITPLTHIPEVIAYKTTKTNKNSCFSPGFSFWTDCSIVN